MLISQFVRFAMVKAAISSIERLLTFKSLSRVQTERMRSELRQAQPDRAIHLAIHLAMQGERCRGLDAMLFRPQPSVVFGIQAGPDVEIGLGLRVAMQLYRMSGFADRDVKFYLGPMNAAVAAGTNSVRNRVAFATDGNTFPPRSQSQFYIFSSMLLPALERAFVKEADCLTALAAADAALAVEAFRADNSGRLPGSLRELVPAYFAEIPIDPATERPLALVPGAVGYAIHANGPVFSVRR